MNDHPGHDAPVLVVASPGSGAARWAAGYAHRRGSPLLVVHGRPRIDALLDELRDHHPGLPVDHRFVAGTLGDTLVTESAHAHTIVLDTSDDEVFDGESAVTAVTAVTALSTLARCPVISVPPGSRWQDEVAPVIVGVHRPERTPQKLEFAFAEAHRLGTGVRLVRCTPRRRADHLDDLDDLLAGLAGRYPDVPVHSEVLDTPATDALAWHAHFGALVVLGSRRAGAVRGALLRSVTRAVLRHGGSPVVVIGDQARRSAAVPELGSARS